MFSKHVWINDKNISIMDIEDSLEKLHEIWRG